MKHYLNPHTNEVFAYELDGSQDHLIPEDYKPLSDAQVKKVRQENEQRRLEALPYDQRRAMEYPSLTEQLDMLWHAMDEGTLPKVESFYNSIKAVKDKYRKAQ